MSKNAGVFEVNGERYDAFTGAYLGSHGSASVTESRTHKPPSEALVWPAVQIASQQQRTAAAPPAASKPAVSRITHVRHMPAHKPQHTRTLMRHAVKPPHRLAAEKAQEKVEVTVKPKAAEQTEKAVKAEHAEKAAPAVQASPQLQTQAQPVAVAVAAKPAATAVQPVVAQPDAASQGTSITVRTDKAKRAEEAERSDKVEHFSSSDAFITTPVAVPVPVPIAAPAPPVVPPPAAQAAVAAAPATAAVRTAQAAAQTPIRPIARRATPVAVQPAPATAVAAPAPAPAPAPQPAPQPQVDRAVVREQSPRAVRTETAVRTAAQPAKSESADKAEKAAPAAHHEQDIFEQALALADSHERKPLKLSLLRAASQRKRFRRTATIGASAAVFLLLAGFIALQNKTAIQLQVASSRAGFSAAAPAYKPEGFGMSKIAYSPGTIATWYTSDNKTFSVIQKKSNWDSQTLLENFVSTTNENFEGFQVNGRTIYIYGTGRATWVNGGVWYQIQAGDTLTNDQLLRVARSI